MFRIKYFIRLKLIGFISLEYILTEETTKRFGWNILRRVGVHSSAAFVTHKLSQLIYNFQLSSNFDRYKQSYRTENHDVKRRNSYVLEEHERSFWELWILRIKESLKICLKKIYRTSRFTKGKPKPKICGAGTWSQLKGDSTPI